MKVLYVKNSNNRNKRFQIQTLIYEENGHRFVKKSALSKEALPHLNQMRDNYNKLSKVIINPKVKLAKIITSNKNSLTFEYIDGENLVKKLQKSKNKEEKITFIEKYNDFLQSSFKTTIFDSTKVSDSCKNIFGDIDYSIFDGTLCFQGISNIDMIFSNIIYKKDEIYIIDYEWVFSYDLPIDYILYRTLKYEFLLNKESSLIQYEEMENNFISSYVYKSSFQEYHKYYAKKRVNIMDFLTQKEQEIQQKEQEIQQLQELAQSMRIKNRIKKILGLYK